MNGNNTSQQFISFMIITMLLGWVDHVYVLKHLRMSRTKVLIWSFKCYDDESHVVPRYKEQDKGLDATRSGWVEFNKESLSSNNSHNLCPTFRLWLICTWNKPDQIRFSAENWNDFWIKICVLDCFQLKYKL